jgi:hypothetical protein
MMRWEMEHRDGYKGRSFEINLYGSGSCSMASYLIVNIETSVSVITVVVTSGHTWIYFCIY